MEEMTIDAAPACCGVPMLHNGSFLYWICMGCGKTVPCNACRLALGLPLMTEGWKEAGR